TASSPCSPGLLAVALRWMAIVTRSKGLGHITAAPWVHGGAMTSTISDTKKHLRSLERRAYSLAETIVDAAVHIVGLVVAIAAGSILLTLALLGTAQDEFPSLVIYVSTLIVVLGISLAYNLSPASPVKHYLARLDQAAIFLFIA